MPSECVGVARKTAPLSRSKYGRYTPLRLQAVLETALRESLEGIEIGSRRLVLSSFSVGAVSPQLLGARTYDIGPDALGFDFDIRRASAPVPFSLMTTDDH